ncbi:MAG: hypothetical protein ABI557_09925, partial [Aureliella sp.]
RVLMEHLLQIIGRQVAQLTRLSDDLLDTARIARGTFSIQKESIEIGQIMADACECVKPYIDRYCAVMPS